MNYIRSENCDSITRSSILTWMSRAPKKLLVTINVTAALVRHDGMQYLSMTVDFAHGFYTAME